MRKVAVCLFVILIIGSAINKLGTAETLYCSIEEIRKQIQDVKWEETYNSYGRNIYINIKPIIPQVDKIPILTCKELISIDKVENNLKKKSELYSMEKLENGISALIKKEVQDLGEEVEWRTNIESVDIESNTVVIKYNPEVNLLNFRPSDRLSYTGKYYYAYDVNEEGSYAENNTLTIDECTELVKKEIDSVLNEKVDFKWNIIKVMSRPYKTIDSNRTIMGEGVDYYSKGSYNLNAYQIVEGIPIIYRCGAIYNLYDNKVKKEIKSRLNRCKTNKLALNILDEYSYTIMMCLKKENSVELEDIPLASFENIKSCIEEEIYKGHIRDIYSIELGYCLYLDPQGEDIFWLYPIWKVECSYLENPKDEKSTFGDDLNYENAEYRDKVEFTTLVINAQTAELYNRTIKNAEITESTFDCPNIIQWEDI